MQIIAKTGFFQTINRKKHILLYHGNWKPIGLKSSRDFLKWVMLYLVIIIEYSELSHSIQVVYFILFVLSHHLRGKKISVAKQSLKVHVCLPTNAYLQFLMAKRCFSFINPRTTAVLFLFVYVYLDQKEWKKLDNFKLYKKNKIKK